MNDRTKVLIVDDDPEFLREFRSFLNERFSPQIESLETASSVSEARQRLAERAFELIVADIDFTDVGETEEAGLELLEFLKTNPELVVILVTGKAPPETVFRGAKAGAFDFFSKRCSIENEVIPRLQMAFARIRAQRRLRELEEALRRRDNQIMVYRKAVYAVSHLVVSVILAAFALAFSSRYLNSGIQRVAVFFGVLLFSSISFQFIRHFVFKIGGLHISARNQRDNTDGR